MSENCGEKLYCKVIGIDLGTSNSVIAVMKGDKVEIISSKEGSDLTPSCVSYSYHKGEVLVGQSAAAKKWTEPKNTIFDAKRFIGMEYDVRLEELASRYYQFKVVDGGKKKPLFSITHKGEPLLKRPQDISALVLERLRDTAERTLKCRATEIVQIREAVITVPAYFSMAQKYATKDAARIAGFEQVKLITEPAAAAYAYGYEKRRLDNYRILVFDFGGGTFDVTVLDVRKGEFVQRAIDGDNLLGGRDLDILLRDHCAAEIKRRWGYDCMEKAHKAQELLEKCEGLKRMLSHSTENSILLKLPNEIVELTVTRETFEALCRPKLMEAVEIVRRLLDDTQLTPDQIDEVLLVGGTSRIPLVSKLLVSELAFDANQLNESENPDHVVAKGAAIYAAQLSDAKNGRNNDQNTGDIKFEPHIPCVMKLSEAIPLSIGSDMMSGVFCPIISRNSRIPSTVTTTFGTGKNDQSWMCFNFYEGERNLVEYNSFLGRLSIFGLPPGMSSSVKVQVTLEIDENGLLTARVTHGGRTEEMSVESYELRKTTDRSVSQALRDAELNSAVDWNEERRLRARNNLELGIERSRYKCFAAWAIDVCDEFDDWLTGNRDTGTRAQFDAKHEELKERLGSAYKSRHLAAH